MTSKLTIPFQIFNTEKSIFESLDILNTLLVLEKSQKFNTTIIE